jgi:hypothetical protein
MKLTRRDLAAAGVFAQRNNLDRAGNGRYRR